MFKSVLTFLFVFTGSLCLAATESSLEAEVGSPSPLFGAIEFQYVPVRYSRYNWGGGSQSEHQGRGFRLAAEVLPLPLRFGKLGIGTAVSYQTLSNVDLGGGRQASLNVIPVETFLTYRFDYVTDQLLVPFVRGGVRWSFARQTPDSIYASDRTRVYPNWDVGGGLQFCLDRVDPSSAHIFDREIGVNATFLVAEYVHSTPTSPTQGNSLAHDEWRAGLRFEF